MKSLELLAIFGEKQKPKGQPMKPIKKMNSLQAAKILKRHNKWRRDGKGKMTDPARLGMAIDVVVELIENTAFIELAKKSKDKK